MVLFLNEHIDAKGSVMTIKVRAVIDTKQIDGMDLTISLTMTVNEWRQVRAAMPDGWPGWEVAQRIDRALKYVETATQVNFVDPLHLTC